MPMAMAAIDIDRADSLAVVVSLHPIGRLLQVVLQVVLMVVVAHMCGLGIGFVRAVAGDRRPAELER